MSPLMIAVDCLAEVGVLRALLAKKADVFQEDNDGHTALDLSNRKCMASLSAEERHRHGEIKEFLLKVCPPRLEFGICGLDVTLDKDKLPELLTPPPRSRVVPVAAFQLAYQGFPWEPAPGYGLRSSLKVRRYPNGETYPAWHEIDDMVAAMPAGTRLSFHLSETKEYPYVSELLKGDDKYVKLVETLCGKDYNARHVQININARGVPPELFLEGTEWDKSAKQIAKLARQNPNTFFLVPCFKKTGEDGKVTVDSLPFICKILQTSAGQSTENRPAKNVVAFFDDSAGTGKTPDAVPAVPKDYLDAKSQAVGFTGGINADNVTDWLTKYEDKAAEHSYACICDAQTGFRKDKNRGQPIDEKALRRLMKNVYSWGMQDPGPERHQRQRRRSFCLSFDARSLFSISFQGEPVHRSSTCAYPNLEKGLRSATEDRDRNASADE